MGAEYSGMNIGYGRTIDEAFGQVHEDAAYYSGHGGYTGTMAEKGGAIMMGELPPRMSMDQFSTLAQNYADYMGIGWGKKGTWLEYKDGRQITHRTTPIPPRLRGKPAFENMLMRYVKQADEKWEDAAAVKANKADRAKHIKGRRGLKRGTQVYLIEGYCSS